MGKKSTVFVSLFVFNYYVVEIYICLYTDRIETCKTSTAAFNVCLSVCDGDCVY